MLRARNSRGGRHNSRIPRSIASSQQEGIHRPLLDVDKFARHYEQAEAEGYLKRQDASTASIPFREPRNSKADDTEIESETIEQQTTDRSKGTGMQGKNYDGTLDPRRLPINTSEYWVTMNPEVLKKEAQAFARAGLRKLEEMEVRNHSDDTAANEVNLDVGADNTEDAVNTTNSGGHFSDGYYVLDGGHFADGYYPLDNTADNTADNTEEVGAVLNDAENAGVPIGQYIPDDIPQPKCYHTEDIDVNKTADGVVHVSDENDAADNTRETSITGLATSCEDMLSEMEKSLSNANAPQNSTAAKDNENPAEVHPSLFIESNVGIDHTEEPEPAEESEETSNSNSSTSTGTESSKESDDMSETTEVPINSLAHQNPVEIQPFNFPGCPEKVRHLILLHVLESKTVIRPYYNFGALELPAQHATRENFASNVVAAFAGDAALIDQATTILYGDNDFHLSDAKVALWWLRRIGPANVSKLHYLALTLDEGVADHFCTRKETLWRHVFALLHDHRHRHRLRSLAIGFQGWTMRPCAEDGLSCEDSRVWEPRYAILRMLLRWRGLGDVEIVPGAFVTRDYAGVLAHAVMMRPGETDEEVEKFEDEVKATVRGRYSFA